MLPRKLVPDSFDVPTVVEGNGFKLVPLGYPLMMKDFDAYMSSVEYLKGHAAPGHSWPEGSTLEDAIIDIGWVEQSWRHRAAFSYAVMTPDESVERACVYVYPSLKLGYEAQGHLWVRESEVAGGFDAELYAWTRDWVRDAWPFHFERVGWPGRETPWGEWEALPDKDPMEL